jgi:hypothetical protein
MTTNYNNRSNNEPTKSAKPTNQWSKKILELVVKIGDIMRELAKIVGEIFVQGFKFIGTAFHEGLRIAMQGIYEVSRAMSSNKLLPVASFVGFTIASAVTWVQWQKVGVFLAGLMGISGFSASVIIGISVIAGFGLNIFQLGSEAYKLNRNLAKDYDKNNIDVNLQTQNPDTVKSRLNNWYSYQYKTLKRLRFLSYTIELGLVGITTLFFDSSTVGLVIAVFALFLPEASLKLLASTSSLAEISTTNDTPLSDRPSRF